MGWRRVDGKEGVYVNYCRGVKFYAQMEVD
jgi:hypothetical protein